MLAGPALVVFLTFVIVPVLMAAYYGFFKWKGFGPPTDFVGFENYLTIFRDPEFLAALRHNGFIVLMSLVLQGPVAVVVALMLNRRMRGRSVVRVLVFVPYVVSEVIVGTGFSLMLSTTGAVNDLLEKIGLGFLSVDWLADPDVAIWTLLLIITWKYIGFAVILFLAGLQGIPDELGEAAAIDGASYWKAQRYVTLRCWARRSGSGRSCRSSARSSCSTSSTSSGASTWPRRPARRPWRRTWSRTAATRGTTGTAARSRSSCSSSPRRGARVPAVRPAP